MNFLKCILYMAAVGVVSFVLGRLVPKGWFDWERFPYRPFSFEKGGKFYHRLKIRQWQDKIPDMSRILPGLMPRKQMPEHPTVKNITRMLQETCVAELTHWLLCLAGLFLLWLWPGVGGILLAFVYIFFGNLPFVAVQRYNRPRLRRMLQHLQTNKAAEKPKE